MTRIIRDTSILTYNDIQEEGLLDTDLQITLDAIRSYPLMTGAEYCKLILGYDNMNKIRPRITDLKNLNCIKSFGKRKCSLTGRLSYVWATLEGAEIHALRYLGFREPKPSLFTFSTEDFTLYQDFTKGKRKSYAFTSSGQPIDYRVLPIHKQFKELIEKFKNKDDERGTRK